MSNPREIENLKGTENLETVIERHYQQSVIESNKKARNRKKNLKKRAKRARNNKKRPEELEKEKINETIVNNPKEILLTYFLRHVWQLINQAKEKKSL